MGFAWKKTPEAAFVPGFDNYRQAMHDGILSIADKRAPEIREWMVANHAWENRTQNAEASLYAEIHDLVERIVIVFGHNMPYSIFLETIQAGTFAVITPALDVWSQVIWDDVRDMTRL